MPSGGVLTDVSPTSYICLTSTHKTDDAEVECYCCNKAQGSAATGRLTVFGQKRWCRSQE